MEEPTIHINLGYVVLMFSLIGTLAVFLTWGITLILKQSTKQHNVDSTIKENKKEIDSTILAIQKEIDLLKNDKVSKIDFVEFATELKHMSKSMEETKKSIDQIKDLMINYNK